MKGTGRRRRRDLHAHFGSGRSQGARAQKRKSQRQSQQNGHRYPGQLLAPPANDCRTRASFRGGLECALQRQPDTLRVTDTLLPVLLQTAFEEGAEHG